MPLATERSSSSLSNASVFRNADSFVSEPEEYASKNDECVESSAKQCLEKCNVNHDETEAFEFQIFHCDDVGKRDPVSVFDLAFHDKEAEDSEVKLILIASPSEPPMSNYMRTIDSWTMRADEKGQLLLYVRDVKGTWCKLCTPAKRYTGVFDDCLIVVSFLELAVKLGSKFKKPHTYYNKIQKLVGVDKSKIRDGLKKYYTSVVQKFVCKGGLPLLRDAPIIRNMKDALKVSTQTPNVPFGKTLKSGVQRKIAMAIRIACKRKRVMDSCPKNINEGGEQKEIGPLKRSLSKRKQVMASESENEIDAGTDLEDLKPLLQRKFKRMKKGSCSEFMAVTDDGMNICSGREQDPNNITGWRSDKIQEVAEVREPEVLKENLDVAEKSAVAIAESTREKIEVPANNLQSGNCAHAELRVLPEMTGIYGGEDDTPDEFDSDDEEVGDAAFCAICDDGGDLLFCDGPCVRSFHASREAAAASSESKCRSMGFRAEEVKEMGSWLCPNCEYKRHQCFICGNLGNSEGENKEVFLCDVALCGRFYHPHCLAIFTNMSKRDSSAFVKRIKDGIESVFCPAHKCLKCLEGEIEGGTDNSMNLAKCRRCPKAYHKICLPPSISFEETDYEPVRAWEIGEEDDPVKRLIIYCTDHMIDDELNTPKRDHLRWPEEYTRKTARRKDSLSAYENDMHKRARKYRVEARDPVGEERSVKAAPVVLVRSKGTLKKPELKKVVSRLSLPTRTDETYASEREQHGPSRIGYAAPQKAYFGRRAGMAVQTMVISREAVMKKVMELQEMSASVVTVESVRKSLFHPSCYVANSRKNFIRRGDLVSIINAAKKAVDKIQGGNIEDAKRICPRAYFQSLSRSEDSLKVYLAPLLHGTRYTSYGRHFTNPDKLKEIIERIHWYIDEGDMVVDFCCGANDFSTLLKEKLDSVGKKCDYKNFDIHPPKLTSPPHSQGQKWIATKFRLGTKNDNNTFAFTKGDWFENKGEGFAEGKKLVMGLNPPFGSKAALATKFVLHALQFRPKLLVLIVPPETMDGGRKYAEFNYGLLWEDRELLSGKAGIFPEPLVDLTREIDEYIQVKSFYLPGSLNKRDEGNLAQWNNVAPPLFLWSPVEMLRKNQQIALQQKHIRSLLPVVPDLHHPVRDLQSEHSQISAMHHLSSKLVVDTQEVRMRTTPVPSPTGMGNFDLRAASGGLPSRSKSPLSDGGSIVPQFLPLRTSSSADEVSSPFSTPHSTPQSSSSSQDGHVADPHLHSFNKKNPFDGRGRGAGVVGHYAGLPNIVPQIPTGVGHLDRNRTRMLISMHGEEHVPTAGGVGPATLMNHRLHGDPPRQRRPPFGMTKIQQGAPSHPQMPLNMSSLARIPLSLPQPPPRPGSPHIPAGMQMHPLVHRGMQPGPGQSMWVLGNLNPPHVPGFAQSMHGARNQPPVHRGDGLQAWPMMDTHTPGTVGRPGVPDLAPPFLNVGFPQGRVGEDSYGRVGGMHRGGPPSFGSGGWIEHDD